MDINKKNYIWNTIGSTLFSFNSLFLAIIVTRINGIANAGIFSLAFSTAGIINYIALYSGRTYQIANTNEKFTDGLFILLRIITVLIAIVFSLGFVLVNNYDVYKATIVLLLCILKCIEALSDVFYGILQKQNYLYIAGESLTFKSLFALLAFVVIDIITHNLVLAIAVFLFVNILFLIFFDIQQSKNRCGMNLSLNRLNFIELAQMGIYTFLFTVLIMIIMNLPKYFIDYFLNNADQGIYGILTMPATFIMMLAQFILQPSLLYLTNCKEQKDYQLFDSRVLKICITILSSLIIIIPTAYFLGVPVLQIIYGVSLEGYRLGLILIIIGSAFYAVSNILLNALVVLDNTKEQFILQVIIFALSLLVCFMLISNFGINGGVYSYATIMLLEFLIYVLFFRIRIDSLIKGSIS